MNAKIGRQKFEEKCDISIISKYLPQIFINREGKPSNFMMNVQQTTP